MPLREGSSDAVVGRNIAKLRREGYPEKQAAAIAYRTAGRGMTTEQRAGLDVPLRRWSSAMLGGRGEVAVRVPESSQDTGYTCGPASLRGALAAFGVTVDEDTLAAAADTSASGGTSIWGLKAAVEEVSEGLVEASCWRDMSLKALHACLERGEVVLVCLQAGEHVERYDASHWVVPCVVGESGVECMDPSVENVRSMCSAEEFVARWHCVDMGKPIVGLALVLTGQSPAAMAEIPSAKTPL